MAKKGKVPAGEGAHEAPHTLREQLKGSGLTEKSATSNRDREKRGEQERPITRQCNFFIGFAPEYLQSFELQQRYGDLQNYLQAVLREFEEGRLQWSEYFPEVGRASLTPLGSQEIIAWFNAGGREQIVSRGLDPQKFLEDVIGIKIQPNEALVGPVEEEEGAKDEKGLEEIRKQMSTEEKVRAGGEKANVANTGAIRNGFGAKVNNGKIVAMPEPELILGGVDPKVVDIDQWDLPEATLDSAPFGPNFGGDLQKKHQKILMLRAVKATFDKQLAEIFKNQTQTRGNLKNSLMFLATDKAISTYANTYALTNREVVEALADKILAGSGLEQRREEFSVLKTWGAKKIYRDLGLKKRWKTEVDTKGAILVRLLGEVLNNPSTPLVPAQYMRRKQNFQTKEPQPAGQTQGNKGTPAEQEPGRKTEQTRVTMADIEGRSATEGVSILIERNGQLTLRDIRNLSRGFENNAFVAKYLTGAINEMGFGQLYRERLKEFQQDNEGAFPTLESMVEAINQLYPIYKVALEKKQGKPSGQKAVGNPAGTGRPTAKERVDALGTAINQRRAGVSEETEPSVAARTVRPGVNTQQIGDQRRVPTLETAVEHLQRKINQTPEGDRKLGLLALQHYIDRMNKEPENKRDEGWTKSLNEALKLAVEQ